MGPVDVREYPGHTHAVINCDLSFFNRPTHFLLPLLGIRQSLGRDDAASPGLRDLLGHADDLENGFVLEKLNCI